MAKTPNLQSSILVSSEAATAALALLAPAQRGRSMHRYRTLISENESTTPGAWRTAHELFSLYDLVTPLERFNEALVVVAAELGLRNVQHHRVSPGCTPHYPERVDLDDAAACRRLERTLAPCERRTVRPAYEAAWERKAAEELARRVSPLDAALHMRASQQLEARLANSPRLRRWTRQFRERTSGVWVGGAPARGACKFARARGANDSLRVVPDFVRHPCTPGPQELMEQVWLDTGYLHRGGLLPNRPECLGGAKPASCVPALPAA